MNKSHLTNPEVKFAILALENDDKETWYNLFTEDPDFTDDGNRISFKSFFDKKEKFTDIIMVENEGLDVIGRFYAGQLGNLLVFFKFRQNDESKFDRLDVGQVVKLLSSKTNSIG